MRTTMEVQDMSMAVEMRLTGRRIGDCPEGDQDR
jgi:hypothetical protein